jgi:hypothetical protein
VTSERYYDAEKYAHSLEYSHGRYHDYHTSLVTNLYSAAIDRAQFMEIAREAGIDLNRPDATSEHPHRILWWNVDVPNHVLLAKHGELEYYWAFSTADDNIMRQLASAYAENDAKRAAEGRRT